MFKHLSDDYTTMLVGNSSKDGLSQTSLLIIKYALIRLNLVEYMVKSHGFQNPCTFLELVTVIVYDVKLCRLILRLPSTTI